MDRLMMDILLSSFNFVSLIILVRFLKHIFYEKQISRTLKIPLFIIILAISVAININFSNFGISLILSVIVYAVIGFIFYEAKAQMKIIVVMFFVVFSFLSELLAAGLLSIIFGNIVQNVRENTMYMFLGGLTSKIILMILIEVVIHFKSRKASKVSISSWIMIISIPFVSVVISVISVYEPIVEKSYNITSGLACLMILYINIIAFYLFDNIIIQVDDNNQYKSREKILKLQQEQYKVVIDGYEQVKKVRHDMIGHLISLDGYIMKEQNKTALEYIHKLSNELDLKKRGVISGHVVVDAIINNRKVIIEKNDIVFKTDIIIPTDMSIDDMDLSILLGNIVNNAIEACLRIQGTTRKKEISLKMKCRNDSMLVEAKNTYDISTIRKRNGKYISSKLHREENQLGMGLSNIEEIVEKYNGVFQTELYEEVFIAKAMIPIKM